MGHVTEQMQSHLGDLEANLQAEIEARVFVRVPPLDTGYTYDRFRVVELTQLICRDIKELPQQINRNRIYQCVKRCYDCLVLRKDNPEGYAGSVRMLLNVCRVAYSWFSVNQLASFERWCKQQGW